MAEMKAEKLDQMKVVTMVDKMGVKMVVWRAGQKVMSWVAQWASKMADMKA